MLGATKFKVVRQGVLQQVGCCSAALAPTSTSPSPAPSQGRNPRFRLVGGASPRPRPLCAALHPTPLRRPPHRAPPARPTPTRSLQVEHLHQQLVPGSVARAQKCHRTTGTAVLGAPRAAGGVGDGARGEEDEEGEEGAETYGEVYEDADFYHALLKELLDDGTAAIPTAGGAPPPAALRTSDGRPALLTRLTAPPADAVAPKLKHKKRKTDNRQSKGRKLSYEVMPKLQNFMFPVVPEHPVILTELFASVFGQRTAADGVLAARPASSEAADGVSCLAAGGDAPSAIVGSLFAPTT